MSYSAAVAMAMTCISLIDVDQTDMISTVISATGGTLTPTLNISSTTTEIVFDALTWNGTTAAVGAQQTQQSNHVTGGGSIRNGTSLETGSSTVAMSWTLAASADWALCAVSVKQLSTVISQGPTSSPVTIFAVTNANTTNTGTSYSFSAETSGSNRALVVVVANTTQSLPNGITYSANALTLEGFTQETPTGRYISIWSLVNPPAGVNPLTLSFSAAVSAAVTVFSLNNVDQFDAVGGYRGASGSTVNTALVVSAGSGDLLIDGLSFDTGTASPTEPDQTLRSQHGNSTVLLATSTKPGIGAATVSWSLSLLDDWAIGVVNVKPFVELSGKAPRGVVMLNLSRWRGERDYDPYTIIAGPVVPDASGTTATTPSNTGSVGPRISLPPPVFTNDEQWKRQTAAWMQEANQGRLANTGIVTLQAGASSTTISDDRVGVDSFIGLMPRTANAAAEHGAGSIYILTAKQSFTIAHANNAQTDRIFVYSILG